MDKFRQRVFVLEFPANIADVTVDFNERMRMAQLQVLAVSHTGATAGGPVMYLDIDDMTAACASENVAGFPLPIFANNSGALFDSPWTIAVPNRSAMKTLHARITDRTGANYAHAGVIAVWLCAVGVDHLDPKPARDALDWHNAMSGTGNYDTRFDWVPGVNEQAHGLPIDGFSIKYQ